ncbi:hypothetical protein [Mycobacterium sp. OTB74]|jgi:hypothetical protein|uniref:hypothetical protein n=1 Tax=Mycobacterium sp. OTB74 TaxID=1853452 RepID=UPI002473C00B|nr:hypothetical protein [Mycobacterium sp. OTB74]MDH6245749.1 hypothetical protein [Mycobacterium sp. OTB74]
MPTTTPSVALPPGAVFADDWDYDDWGADAPRDMVRCVSSAKLRITGSPVTVCVDALQREDGTLVCVDMNIRPTEALLLDANADQCRELAAHLLELAPLLDTWGSMRAAE